jgi:hypothetical protein
LDHRIGRVLAATGAAAALTLGLAGCASVLPADQVASAIDQQLQAQQIPAEGVRCPEDLPAEVGDSVRCEFTVEGQPVDAVATVTSVHRDTADFEITSEARPVARALLEQKIGQQLGSELGVTVESTNCSGDLQPQVDQSVNCTVTAEGETADFTVVVTAVDGGLINYSIESAG